MGTPNFVEIGPKVWEALVTIEAHIKILKKILFQLQDHGKPKMLILTSPISLYKKVSKNSGDVKISKVFGI